jgi:hypothetical protein
MLYHIRQHCIPIAEIQKKKNKKKKVSWSVGSIHHTQQTYLSYNYLCQKVKTLTAAI